MTVYIISDSSKYSFTVKGDAEVWQITSDIELLEGALDGKIELDGKLYDVTAGFKKDLNTNLMNAGIVINPMVEAKDQIMFAFGDVVISEEIQSIIDANYEEAQTYAEISEQAGVYASNFTTLSSTVQTLSGASVNGQKLTGYYNATSKRVGARVQTYCSAIKTYYTNQNYTNCNVKVKEISITLQRKSNTEASSILNIDGIFNAYVGVANKSLANLILSVLSDFGVPTSTLQTALNGLTGTLSTSVTGSNTSITAAFGTGSNTSGLDSAGMVALFNLYNPTTAHTANYYIKSNVKYSVTHNIPLSGATTFIVSANQATLDCALNV